MKKKGHIKTKFEVLFAKFFFWLNGYYIIKSFYPVELCEYVRDYAEREVKWLTGESMAHGSFATSENEKFFEFNRVIPEEKLNSAEGYVSWLLGEELVDVGFRTLQCRLCSPAWHIDAQTFANDFPMVALDKHFRVVKCGVYLQNRNVNNIGTLELAWPFLGGGLKNFYKSPLNNENINEAAKTTGRPFIKWAKFGLKVSKGIQFITHTPKIEAGDLVIFDAMLMHRASGSERNDRVTKDSLTGYYVDTESTKAKLMVQWGYAVNNSPGRLYLDHWKNVKKI